MNAWMCVCVYAVILSILGARVSAFRHAVWSFQPGSYRIKTYVVLIFYDASYYT